MSYSDVNSPVNYKIILKKCNDKKSHCDIYVEIMLSEIFVIRTSAFVDPMMQSLSDII